MPSFKPTQLWEASAHTLAKLEIVRRYLSLWFMILGSNPKNRRLSYIDGFAGPGRYLNADKGSPILAIDAARWASTQRNNVVDYSFLFVEKKSEFAAALQDEIRGLKLPETFSWDVKRGTFDEHVGGLLESLRLQGKNLGPTFAFIDPFGATGLPFKIIAEILGHQSCEILLNLDSDGIGRLVTAQEFEKNQDHLDTLFGNSSWRTELDPKLPLARLSGQVLGLYKRQLRSVARYVFAFAMNSREGQLNYHLVFASQHPLGLKKMKEAMKAVDQTGTYSFSDDTAGQELLQFHFSDHSEYASKMEKTLGGQWRPYAEYDDYALNETPFDNPKAMLKELEKRGSLELECTPDRKKGSFPDGKIRRIFIHRRLL